MALFSIPFILATITLRLCFCGVLSRRQSKSCTLNWSRGRTAPAASSADRAFGRLARCTLLEYYFHPPWFIKSELKLHYHTLFILMSLGFASREFHIDDVLKYRFMIYEKSLRIQLHVVLKKNYLHYFRLPPKWYTPDLLNDIWKSARHRNKVAVHSRSVHQKHFLFPPLLIEGCAQGKYCLCHK